MSNISGCQLYQERGNDKYCKADADWNKFNFYKKHRVSMIKYKQELLRYGKFSKCQDLHKAAKYLIPHK